MHKKIIFTSIIFLYLLCFLGCANLKTKEISPYVPSLVEKELDLKIGMTLLEDERPAVDRKLMADIKNVPEEVTAKLIEYFTATGPIKQIRYPAEEDDDVVISGKIHRFVWRSYSKVSTYIPLVNLYVYLGIPCKTAYGLTHISLELKDNKTGRTVEKFDEYSKVARSYNLYEFKEVDFAVELEKSFKEVTSKLRNKVILEIRVFRRRSQAK